MNNKRILAVFFICFSGALPSCLQSRGTDNVYVSNEEFDSVYSYAGTDLYKHDDIINTEEFKKAQLPEQQTMLFEAFKKRRLKASFAEYGASIVYSMPTLAVIVAAYRYRDRLAALPQGLSLGAFFAFQNQLTGFVENQYERIYKLFSKMAVSSKAVPEKVIEYETKYVKNKPWIAANLQEVIEENLLALRARNHINLSEKTRNLELLEIALNLPLRVKKISYNSARINQTVTGYSVQTALNIKRYCIRHVAACQADSIRKVAAYFYGLPGIGKTRAARLIAEALEVPFEVISLGDVGVKELFGTEDDPGLLLKVLARAKYEGENAKNMILLIDDVDRVLLNPAEYDLGSALLTLLEPETKSFFSPYLNTDVEIPHLGLVLGANKKPTDEALANRLHIIEFEGYGIDYKKEVVWDELFPSLLAPHEKAELALTNGDFTQADTDAINTLIEKDTDPGFRSIKLQVMNYLEDKVLIKYFGMTSREVDKAEQRSPEKSDQRETAQDEDHFFQEEDIKVVH
jgi:ATP-dependent Lon protease